MKVKISSIIKFIFVVLILIRYSFLKLLGNQLTIFSTAYDQYPMVMFYIFMVIFLFLFSRVYSVEAKYLWILSVLCLFATGVGIYSATSNNGLDFMGALSQGIEYIYVILAIPLCYLLNNELWDFRNLLKLLVVLGIVSYAIRWGISFYYDVSGTVAFPNIAQESASSEWIREGVLRVNPPFIGIIFAFRFLRESETDVISLSLIDECRTYISKKSSGFEKVRERSITFKGGIYPESRHTRIFIFILITPFRLVSTLYIFAVTFS